MEPCDLVSATFNEPTDLMSSEISPNLSGDTGFHSAWENKMISDTKVLAKTNWSNNISRKYYL